MLKTDGMQVNKSALTSRKNDRIGDPGPQFSFLLPTRGRPDLVRRFFQSIVETTSRLKDLEIILALDEDDKESQNITHDLLRIKKVILPKGENMGILNRACFAASSGRYVMLVNDDIILRTPSWDQTVEDAFSSFSDEIALIHVNDLLFREKLCTFPFLSRRACLEVGACPGEYQRYRIDDHIYDIYNLLAYLGYKRILYLPEVVFEHENHTAEGVEGQEHVFKSAENKVYSPNQEIIERDARIFDQKMEERKGAALRLARLIDEKHREEKRVGRERLNQELLAPIQDPFSYRRDHFVRKYPSPAKTTIAVVTADIRNPYAAQCLSLIKKYTSNYELLIHDNGKNKDFSHPREMNKVLRNVETDYLVLMDDDIWVEEGWLEGLLKGMDEKTGVVAPLHKDRNGMISFSGAYLAGDGLGTHEHTLDRPEALRVMQVYCSALILIDMKKCGHILMDEIYHKYFFDLVHGLRVWESGYKAVCTPEVVATHLGGATMKWGSSEANELLKKDQTNFIHHWVKNGRLAGLEQGIWQEFPYLKSMVEIPRRIEKLPGVAKTLGQDCFEREANALLSESWNYNLFKRGLETQLHRCLSSFSLAGEKGIEEFCRTAVAQLKNRPPERSWSLGSKPRKTPVLSVLVSVYRSERFLRGLLENLESQTMAGKLEVVIVNNNSPENEEAIIREFQRQYENIVFLRTPEQESPYASLNRAIQLSRGRYLALANVDDRHRSDALEKMTGVLESHPEVALAYGDMAITPRENETFDRAHPCGFYRWPDFDPRLLFQICYVGPQPVWRREMHERYGYFDPEFWSAGDYEFWLRIVQKEKFLHVPDVLGLYCLSPDRNDSCKKVLSEQECEKVRERYWPAEWGNRPKPFLNQNPYLVAQPDFNYPIIKQFLRLKQQGVHLYQKGDRMRAENAFQMALKMAPRDPDVLVSLGRICYDTGRDTEALRYLKEALQVNLRDPAAWAGVALVTLRLKDTKTFTKAREQLLALDPRHPLLPSLEKVAIKSGDHFSLKSEGKNTPLGLSGPLSA